MVPKPYPWPYSSLNSDWNIFRPKELNDLLALKLAPNVTTSLLERISELHMSHSGLKTSLAELKYLETASKLPLYGLHQFHVKDGEETHIILSVYSGGIMVFEKGTLIKTWPGLSGLLDPVRGPNSLFWSSQRYNVKSNCLALYSWTILQALNILCPSPSWNCIKLNFKDWIPVSDVRDGQTDLANLNGTSSLLQKGSFKTWRRIKTYSKI